MAEAPTRRQRKPKADSNDATEPEEDTRWWVIITPANEMLSIARYGVWNEKPKCMVHENGTLHFYGKQPDEPELYVGGNNSVAAAVGQMQHFEARPAGQDDSDVEQ